MKTLQDMTELEILALSNDQIEKIIKFRKAQEGIKLLERPVEPEYEDVPEKDVTYYKVHNLNCYRFLTIEKANKVVDALKDSIGDGALYAKWNSKNPISLSQLEDYYRKEAQFTIEEEQTFSPQIAEAAEQAEKRNAQLRECYEADKKEYEKYVEEIQWLIDEVWDKVFAIRNKYQKLQRLQNDYAEYLVLAEKDEKVATNFLRKANVITDEELKIIKGKKIIL